MCGIAGCVRRRDRAEASTVDRMLDELMHRGPDARGVHAGTRGAIGQTRLSIIDLVTGDPPIATPDNRIGVALNGEIYNFAALRHELLATGHVLHTTGDTEVIAHLAETHTPTELAARLEGMFSFAVWDEGDGRLVLGRDRFGKKPLFWWCDGDTFAFGSEIKALLAHPAVTSELDESVIGDYLTFGYVPTPRTFYRGITSVPPGHVLVLDGDLKPRLERYWHPHVPGRDSVTAFDDPLATNARRVREALDKAVRRRLVADVPLGAFLSGGVDSGGIVALMAQAMDRPVQTFTIGFDGDDGYDERRYARLVADRYATDHTEFVVRPQAVDLVERLVWHHDQPFGDSSAVPTFMLSELTGGEVTVALSGDGGDELFAGYERFNASLLAARYAGLPPLVQRGVAAGLRIVPDGGRRHLGGKVRRWEREAERGLPDALRAWTSYVPDDVRAALVAGHDDRTGIDDYHEQWAATAGASTLSRVLLLNLRTYLLDDLLPKADRMSMAHGLEVRSPFLDTDLADLAFRLPDSAKVRGRTQKRVLKEALRDLLPAEILDRPKQGFGVPLDRWFRDDLSGYVGATLGSPDASVRRYLHGDALDLLLAQHASASHQHGPVLWSLLTLEVFLRQHGW